MARPKQYQSVSAKQAAYRLRQRATTVAVDRAAWDRLHQRLEALQSAVAEAARRGDPLARRCRAASIDTMLDKLISTFQAAASASPEPTPQRAATKPTIREK
jgi:hypothetical protein